MLGALRPGRSSPPAPEEAGRRIGSRPSLVTGEAFLLAGAVLVVLLATLLPAGGDRSVLRIRLLGDIGDFLVSGDAHTILMQIGGNVALFVPVGFLAPLVIRRLDTGIRTILAATGLSIGVEVTQYLLPIGRIASIDDVLLNTVGGMAGYLLLGLSRRFLLRASPADES